MAIYFLFQCSFFVCRKDLTENEEEVMAFAEQWINRGSESFPCFYSAEDPNSVIVAKKHTKVHVINSMVWPSLVIVVCGIIFLYLETKRRGMPFCGEKIVGNTCSPSHFKHPHGQGTNGKQAHNTLLESYPNSDSYSKIKCKLAQSPGEKQELFHSMPSQIDQIRPSKQKTHNQGPKIVIEDVTRSVSADGLYDINTEINIPGKKQHLADYRQDSTQSQASTGSQGSRLTGQETPV